MNHQARIDRLERIRPAPPPVVAPKEPFDEAGFAVIWLELVADNPSLVRFYDGTMPNDGEGAPDDVD